MVCQKCEKKTSTLATAETSKSSGKTRAVGTNMLLAARAKAAPYAKPGQSKSTLNPYGNKCLDCKQSVQQNNASRCQKCAYKKGLCAICGTMTLNTKRYKQSAK